MGRIQKFEDLDVWKLARSVVNRVYGFTRKEQFRRDFALTDQIRRSSISIMSNIAEGFESGTDAQFARYLDIAKSSCGECMSQLYISLDQQYINDSEFELVFNDLAVLSKQIASLSRYLRKKP